MFKPSPICFGLCATLFLSATNFSAAFPPGPCEFRVRANASSPFIFGPCPDGPVEVIEFSGTLLVREWPCKGYTKTVLPDGRGQIEIEILEEADMVGYSPTLDATVGKKHKANVVERGTITQITPGVDFPAHFQMGRSIVVETPLGPFTHDAPINIEATIDRIPPVFDPNLPDFNVFRGTDPPVPFRDSNGDIVGFLVITDHRTIITEVMSLIPALGTWGLVSMTLLLLTAGSLVLKQAYSSGVSARNAVRAAAARRSRDDR